MTDPLEEKQEKMKNLTKEKKRQTVKRTNENQRSSHKWNWKYVSKFKRKTKIRKAWSETKKLELPQMKMKKESNVKKPTSVIPS